VRAITGHDTGKSGVPKNGASPRLFQRPLAAAKKTQIRRLPAVVTKAPALGDRDFGATAVMQWRCDTGLERQPG
jgi:hypothetical protein